MKAPHALSSFLLAITALLPTLARGDVPAKVTYQDHILPIFKNACLNCHNPDKKKAGLDLSTYQAALAGSDNGKVVESGNSAGSPLVKCCKQTEDPKMPPKGDKLSDADIALLEKWITGQLLETANGKAVIASNNVQMAVVSLTRPDGPPPMPLTDLPLEPFVRTKGTNALVALAASPWAPLVAVGGQKQIILYQTETLQPLGILPFPEGFPAIIRFSRNGKMLLTGGGLGGKSGKVVLWDVQTGERAGEVGNEFDQVLGADLSPDQAHVALGGPGKILKIYSTKDGKLEFSLKKHTDWITAVAFSPDGKYLASADRNGGIAVWEGATGQEFSTLAGHKAAVTALAFMPGVLASASEDGKITLWDVKEGKEIRTWTGHEGGVESVDFTPDGRLVSAGRDKLVKAWDQTGKVLMTSEPFQDIALRAVLAEDRVIAGDWTGSIRVFNLKDGGKAQGELTSNPLPIAESLARCTKLLEESKATQVAQTAALAAAEAALKTALDVESQKLTAGKVAAEAAVKQLREELEAAKGAPARAEEELKAAHTQGSEAENALKTANEADRPAAQKLMDERTSQVNEAEGKLAKLRAETPGKLAALEKKLQEATGALARSDEALRQSPKLPPAPELTARLEEAKAKAQAATVEVDRVTKLRDTIKAGTPEYTQFEARLDRRKTAEAEAQADLEKAKAAAIGSPQEAEVARCKSALEQAKAQETVQAAALQHWQRAQAFMVVHKSKQALAELMARQQELAAAAKDALSPIAKAEADLAAAQKTAQETPALLQQKEAALAAARTTTEQAGKAAEVAEAALANAEQRRKAAAETEQKATTDVLPLTKRLMAAKAALERQEKLEKPAEGTPEFAAAEANGKAQQDEITQSQTALDAANKVIADAKQQSEAVVAEIAKAKETIASTKLEAKKSAAELAKVEAALKATRQAGDEAQKTIAELTPKKEEIAAAAHSAQARAEQESTEVSRQLEAAKAEAERTRVEYEAHYRPATAVSAVREKPIVAF